VSFGELGGGLRPLDGGWSGETFLADAGGERSVVRVFADPRHDPHAAEIHEALHRLVRGLVPVPEVLEVRRADPATGTPALLVTEFVEGVRGDLLLPDLDEEQQGRLGRRLGEVAGTLAGPSPTRPCGSRRSRWT
jgi:aminoglycoside phosphotransferase (APT) family kinase protein